MASFNTLPCFDRSCALIDLLRIRVKHFLTGSSSSVSSMVARRMLLNGCELGSSLKMYFTR